MSERISDEELAGWSSAESLARCGDPGSETAVYLLAALETERKYVKELEAACAVLKRAGEYEKTERLALDNALKGRDREVEGLRAKVARLERLRALWVECVENDTHFEDDPRVRAILTQAEGDETP